MMKSCVAGYVFDRNIGLALHGGQGIAPVPAITPWFI
jgi:hypothetical protein